MSKASAMAKATGAPAPTPAAPSTAGLTVSPRQASRTLVPRSEVLPATPGGNTPAAATPAPKDPTAVPPVDPTAPPAVATDPQDEKFQQFAKQQAAIQKDRDALKAERAKMQEDLTRVEAVRKQWQDFETMKAKDPLGAMKLAGFSDTDIFNFYAKAEEAKKFADTPEAKAQALAKAEIDKFKQEQETKAQADQATNDARVISNFKSQISQAVSSDKDKYEFCNHYGAEAEALIYATVEQVLKDSNEVLTPAEAADMVESFYETRHKTASSLKKITPQAAAEPTPEPVPEPTGRKTLSNRVTATVASSAPKKETYAEKRQRLENMIRTQGLRK